MSTTIEVVAGRLVAGDMLVYKNEQALVLIIDANEQDCDVSYVMWQRVPSFTSMYKGSCTRNVRSWTSGGWTVFRHVGQ